MSRHSKLAFPSVGLYRNVGLGTLCRPFILLYIKERDRLEGFSLFCQEFFFAIVVLPIFEGKILLGFGGQKIDFPQFLQQMPVSPFQTSCMRVLRASRT